MRLNQALEEIKQENLVSFFMPGHKMGSEFHKYFQVDLSKDITEIPGADYLHDAKGPILETERALSDFYGSDETKILVNGSTVGILSMILGSVDRGEKLILNRNAHKSVYHALELGGIEPIYLYPEMESSLQIVESIDFNVFKETIENHKDAKAILLTYPTYEGVCYPIEEMITLCHENGIVVLVDEAHGAHLCLSHNLPTSALDFGADVVVQSFHKTLPSMTQTAGLHFSKSNSLRREQKERIIWHLSVLQTSSPSYVLMASIDGMLSMLEDIGRDRMTQLLKEINRFEDQIKALYAFELKRFKGMDPSKLILTTRYDLKVLGFDGLWLSDQLRTSFGIQVEYATQDLCLLMPSICNVSSDFDRLFQALKSLQDHYDWSDEIKARPILGGIRLSSVSTYRFSPYEVFKQPGERLPLDLVADRVSKEYVIPYPPGIPLLVPGEVITQDTLNLIQKYKDQLMTLSEEGILVVASE